MIDPQAEAIKRLISMAKSGAQRTPLAPRVTADPVDPPVGLLWIREDEEKAYLKTSEDTTLLVASAAPVAGEGGQIITSRSLPGDALMLNTLTSDEIRSEAIGSEELAPGAVTGEKWAPTIDAESNLFLDAQNLTRPGLHVDVPFDHVSDVLRAEFNGLPRFRVSGTHVSVGTDLPQSAMSIQTAGTDTALRIRGGGAPLLAEKTNGQTLLSVDASGNLVIAGSITSLSGNSGTAGSMAVQGALTVTDQVNFLAGLQVAGRADFLGELDINGQVAFQSEIFLPESYSAKIGQGVHLRTIAAEENRLVLEGVSAVGEAEIQFGTGGPVLRGSLAQSDRMFVGDQRIVTSAPNGILGNQLATDTITGGVGAGLGNIAAETITGYNVKNGSITSTELSPGAVVRAAIDAGAVGPVELADGSVIDRVVASMGVGKLIAGTFNADEVFMGPSGHIYLGPTFASEILGERIQIDASGIKAYNAFNTPLAEFTPGGFTLRTGVDGARLEFDAATGLELFGLTGERTGYLSPLGEFQLDSIIDGARMTLNSGEGIQFYAGATTNLAYNPGFIGSSEHEIPVAGEATNDQRHVFAGEYAVRFRATNPNINAPSYVDVPFKNTVGTGSSVTRTRVNHCTNPSVESVSTGWLASAQTAQAGTFGAALGFIRDRAVWVVATAAGAASIQAPITSTTGGLQWALSCSVRVSTGQSVMAEVIWYDVNSAVISTVVSTPFVLKSNLVTQIGLVASAPANATSFRLRVTGSLQNTDRLEISNILYERTSGIDAYFDGFSEGYQWDGAPGISTSSLIPVPVLDSAQNLLSIFVWSDFPAWAQIEGRDSTANVSRGMSIATQLIPNQWNRVVVLCSGIMDKVRLHYPSTDPSRQTRITATPVWWSGLQVEADKDVATPFCSGNEPGCRWRGLAGKSPSIRDRDVVVTQISPTLGTSVSGAIVGGSLTSASFFAGRIFGTYINGGTIEGNIIKGNQITGDQILAGTIQGTAITARTITADRIATDSLTANEIAAGTITATEMSADSITTVKLAANAVTAEKITVGSITADKLQANMILSQKIIVGAAATGARVELTPGMGLQSFTASGVRTFWIDSATGNLTAIGKWTTGTSGERVEILTDGTMRFYQSTGSNYSYIANNGTELAFRGPSSGGDSGHLRLHGSYVAINWGPLSGQADASFSADAAGIQQWGRLLGMRYEQRYPGDGTQPRIFMLATATNGTDIGSSVIHIFYRGSTAGPCLSGVGENASLLLNDGIVGAGTGDGVNYQRFVCAGFDSASSMEIKEQIAEIEIPEDRTSWDVIEGAPSQDWYYTHERGRENITGKSVLDSSGNPVMVRRRRQLEDGSGAPDTDENQFDIVPQVYTARPTARRKHRFPMAEDLLAMDPDLVNYGALGGLNDLTVDLRDMIGVLWDAVDMLIKRNRTIEAKLVARFPNLNFPDRPQKGDVVEGIGMLSPGRTRRKLDPDTGQITRRRNRP